MPCILTEIKAYTLHSRVLTLYALHSPVVTLYA